MERFGIQTRHGYPCAPVVREDIVRAAIEALGPCTHKGAVNIDGTIQEIVREFLFKAAAEIGKPRIADIRLMLAAHLEGLEVLEESYRALDSLSLLELEHAGAFKGPWFDPSAWSDISTREFDALWSGKGSVILAFLYEQISATKKAIDGLPADKGGRGTGTGSSANYSLVASCVAVSHFWNPSVISTARRTSDKGDLRAFVSYIYEIATGREGVELESDVKKCVRKYRNIMKRAEKEGRAIEAAVQLKVSLECGDFADPAEIRAEAAARILSD